MTHYAVTHPEDAKRGCLSVPDNPPKRELQPRGSSPGPRSPSGRVSAGPSSGPAGAPPWRSPSTSRVMPGTSSANASTKTSRNPLPDCPLCRCSATAGRATSAKTRTTTGTRDHPREAIGTPFQAASAPALLQERGAVPCHRVRPLGVSRSEIVEGSYGRNRRPKAGFTWGSQYSELPCRESSPDDP